MRYEFIVRDHEGNIVFAVDKPSLEMVNEEIGRYERNLEKKVKLDEGILLKSEELYDI